MLPFGPRTSDSLEGDQIGVTVPDLDSALYGEPRGYTGLPRGAGLTGHGLSVQVADVDGERVMPQLAMPFDARMRW